MNITSVEGTVWIIDVTGERTLARSGDILLPGQRLMAGENGHATVASPDGQGALDLAAGQSLEVPQNAAGEDLVVEFDEILRSQVSADLAQESVLGDSQLEALLTALDAGEDPFDVLEDPAAGLGGGAGANNGHSFVRLLRVLEQVSPLAYDYGLNSGDNQEFPLFVGDIVDGDTDETPDNGVSLGGLVGGPDGSGLGGGLEDIDGLPPGIGSAELLVRESGLTGGSDPSGGAAQQESSFTFSSEDGLGTLVVADVALTLADLLALSSGPQSIESPHGVLWLDAFAGDGTGGTVFYHYELLSAVDNDTVPGATDAGLIESFVVTVTDVDGDTTTGSLDVLILDDVPDVTVTGPIIVSEGEEVSGVWQEVEGADAIVSTQVVVEGVAGTFALGDEIELPDGVLVIHADGTWTFTATDGRDQTLERAVEFTIVATDGDGDQAVADHRIVIQDAAEPTTPGDGGDPASAPGEVVLDEEGLPGGVIGGPGDVAGEVVSVSGQLGYDFGEDGPATGGGFTWSLEGLPQLTSQGEPLTYRLEGDGQVLLAETPDGEEVLRVAVTDVASGTFEVVLSGPLDHPLGDTEDDIVVAVGYTVTDIDGSTADGQLDLRLDDDSPVVNLSVDEGTTVVDGQVLASEGETVTGSWAIEPGADGVGVIEVMVNDTPLTFTSLPNTSDEVTVALPQGDLTLRGDGSWSFTAATGLDNSQEQAVNVVLRVTDGDGDVSEVDISASILDAAAPTTPTDGGDPGAGPGEVVLDEDGLSGGNAGGVGDVAGEAIRVSGQLGYDFGDDGPAAIGAFAWSLSGLPALTSMGQELVYRLADDGQSLVAATDAGVEVLRVALTDLASGSFEVLLSGPLDHPQNSEEDDLSMRLGYTLTDIDGSQATGGLDIRIDDDTPVATVAPDTGTLVVDGVVQATEGETVTGTWSIQPGADSLASIEVLVNGMPLLFDRLPAANEEASLALPQGELTLRGDGSWAFTAADGLDNSVDQVVDVVLRVTDGDGDIVEVDISGEVRDAARPTTPTDGGDPAAAPAEVVLDEDGLAGGIAGGAGDVAGEATSVTGQLGYDFGDDGPASSGAFAWSLSGLPALTSMGQAVAFTLSNDGQTLVAATQAGDEVLRVTLTDLATGAFEVRLAAPIDHAETSVEDDVSLSLAYTLTDVDGSQATGGLDIRIDDDMPVATVAPDAGTTVIGGVIQADEGETVTGQWSIQPGADGLGSIDVLINGSPLSFDRLPATSDEVSLPLPQGELTLKGDGSWSFTAAVGLDNSVAQTVDVVLRVTDADGDVVEIDVSGAINDAASPTTPSDGGDPNAAPAEVVLDEDGLAGGVAGGNGDVPGAATLVSGQLGYDFGDDGPAASGAFAWSLTGLPALTSQGQALTYRLADDGQTLVAATQEGTEVLRVSLTDLALGTFEVSLLAPLDHPENSVEDDLSLSLGYTLTDLDGSQATGGLDIRIDDDMPVASVVADEGVDVVDGVIQADEGETISGQWSIQPGADGLAGIEVVINGSPLAFDRLPDSSDSGTLTLPQGQLTLNGDGSWTFTAATGLDNSVGQLVDVVLRVTDGDGDVTEIDISGEVLDAARPTTPSDGGDPAAGPGQIVLDEDGLAGGIAGGDGDVVGEATQISGQLGYDFGDDGPARDGAFTWSLDGLPVLTSLGESVVYRLADNGWTVIAETASGDEVLRVALTDMTTGDFEVTLSAVVDHPQNSIEDSLSLAVDYTLTDLDGSTATGTLDVVVNDDTPTASVTTSDGTEIAGTIEVDEGATISGQWAIAGGADGLAAVDVVVNGTSLPFTALPGPADEEVLTLPQGDLTLRGDGSWSFTAATGLDNSSPQEVNVVLNVTDSDGDVVMIDISGQIRDVATPTTPTDGGDPAAAPAEVVLDEDGLVGGNAGGDGDVTGETTLVSGLLGYEFGDDGPAANGAFTWSVSGLPELTSDGETLVYRLDDDGQTLLAESSSGDEVLRVALTDVVAGTFEVSLSGPLDHTESLTEDDLAFSVSYTVTDIDGSTADGHLDIRIDDDTPVASVTPDAGTIVDNGVIQTEEGATVTGVWSIQPGGDGLGAIELLVNGSPLSVVSLPGPGESTVLSLAQGELTVNGDGGWSFTAAKGLDNSLDQRIDVVLRVIDGDGDVVEVDISGEIQDAAAPTTPTDGGDPGAAPAEVVLDEEGLPGGIAGGPEDVAGESTRSSGLLGYDFGEDGPASSGAFSWSLSDLPSLTSMGQALTYRLADDGQTLVAETPTGEAILTVAVTDLATGAFEVTLTGPLDHPVSSVEDDLAFTVGYTLTDLDGSTATGELDLRIDDDSPVASITPDDNVNVVDDVIQTAEGESVTGSWVVDAGADGLGAIEVVVNGSPSTFTRLPAIDETTTISLPQGELVIAGDGQWIFTAATGLDNSSDQRVDVVLRVTDGDGDVTEIDISADIADAATPTTPTDGGDPAAGPGEVVLDEDGLEGGIVGGDGDVPGRFTLVSGVLGYDFGDDGAAGTGAFSWSTSGLPAWTSAGEALSYSLADDGLVLLASTASGSEVLRIALVDVATGAFEVTLSGPLDHPVNTTEDDLALSVGYVVTDLDGSTANGELEVRIDDDTPGPIVAESGIISEDTRGSLGLDGGYGADGSGESIGFQEGIDGTPVLDIQGNIILFNGDALGWQLSADGKELVALTSDGAIGFRVVLDEANDRYLLQTEDGERSFFTRLAVPIDGIDTVTGGTEAILDLGEPDLDSQVVYSATNGVSLLDGGLVVGAGQISDGDVVRIDMVEGASRGSAGVTWDSAIRVGAFSQTIHVDGVANARATLILTAEEFTPGGGTPNDLALGADDLRILDGRGIDVSNEVRITETTEGLRVEGIQDGWTFVLVRLEGMQSVTIKEGNGEPFRLGDVEIVRGAAPGDAYLNLGLTATDGDGDQTSGELALVVPGAGEFVVASNANNTITTSGGDDVVIADTGGSFVIVNPAGNYNLSFILDSSDSMLTEVDTLRPDGAGNYTRLELLQAAMVRQLETLADFEGIVNLQLIDFDGRVRNPVIFADFDRDNLQDAISYVMGMQASGTTNFEAGLRAGTGFLEDMSLVNSYESTAIFVTDGRPVAWVDDDGEIVIPKPVQEGSLTAMQEAVDAYKDLLQYADSVHGIGIGEGSLVDYIRYFDNTDVSGEDVELTLLDGNVFTGTAGEADIVNTEEGLNLALDTGSSESGLEPLGNDLVFAGAGDDLVFGDTVNSDALSWTDGDTGEVFLAGEHDGMGYLGLYEFLKWSAEHGDGEPLNQDEIKRYVLDNVDELMNLSRQDGGNDTLYGQGGNDVLIGAAGQDVLVGGRGDDVMWGGLGQDSFVWEDGDIVPDVPEVDRIEDFVLGSDDEADRLDLSGILSDGAAADISSYLVAVNEGDTLVLKVKSDGGIDASGSNADLTIELAGLGGSGTGGDILQRMLDDGQLIVE